MAAARAARAAPLAVRAARVARARPAARATKACAADGEAAAKGAGAARVARAAAAAETEGAAACGRSPARSTDRSTARTRQRHVSASAACSDRRRRQPRTGRSGVSRGEAGARPPARYAPIAQRPCSGGVPRAIPVGPRLAYLDCRLVLRPRFCPPPASWALRLAPSERVGHLLWLTRRAALAPLVEPALVVGVHEHAVGELRGSLEMCAQPAGDHAEPIVQARVEPLRLRVVGKGRDGAVAGEVVHDDRVRVDLGLDLGGLRAKRRKMVAIEVARCRLRQARIAGRIRAVPRGADHDRLLEDSVRRGAGAQG